MEHTTAIIFAALAVIGVAVVILTTIRKTKKAEDNKMSQVDKENDEYINYLKRQRQETAFIESYQWEDDPSIPSEDEWMSKPCKVIQRNDRHKIINTTFGEAYKMAQKCIDMCFEHFEGRSSLWFPFVVVSVEDESAIDERDRPSQRFWYRCEGYSHTKRVEFNNAKKDKYSEDEIGNPIVIYNKKD